MTKEQMCKLLTDTYGWSFEELLKYNEGQVRTLYHSCLDEDGKLRTQK